MVPVPADTPRWQAYTAPGVDLSMFPPLALAEAHEQMSRLTDPDLIGKAPGLPQRKVDGTCRICAQDDTLTFEHIPPQATGNKTRARVMRSADMLDRGLDADFPRSGHSQAQRGSGAHVLCKACNENGAAGKHLVKEYAELTKAFTDNLLTACIPLRDGTLGLPKTLDITLHGYALGRAARQALIMLMAVSGGAAVTRLHPALRDIAAGKDLQPPPGIRLGLALALGRDRFGPPHLLAGPGGVQVFIEVAAPPCRWTLSWAAEHLVAPEGTADVTDWLGLGFNDGPTVMVTLPVGMIIGAAPGDTRDHATIMRERS